MQSFLISRFHLWRAWLLVLSVSGFAAHASHEPREYVVQASAVVTTSPPSITLVWPAQATAGSYQIFRRSGIAEAWTLLTNRPAGASSAVDTTVAIGTPYEYRIVTTTTFGAAAYGYVSSGINLPLVENRGTLLLLVDATMTTPLASELGRLAEDLRGDGWKVNRQNVPRAELPPAIRNRIRNEFYADPTNLKAVLLFGHLAVPRSGNYEADDHANHKGAWSADTYYGDVDGNWTDSLISNGAAASPRNWNFPGDGRFDQSLIPSDVELQVGRIDLSDLGFALSETELLRQYLEKHHRFRHRFFNADRRGLIADNFGVDSETLGKIGWGNLSALFGASQVNAVGFNRFFPTLSTQSHLWSYGCGGGSYDFCNGIGYSGGFQANDPQTVFTMFFGSYFPDFDSPGNFLRAPLASRSFTLASLNANRPAAFVHHMGMGETIGFSTRLTQNNRDTYHPVGYTRLVHVALMGDPALRMHIVAPPQNVRVRFDRGSRLIEWDVASDDGIVGYHVYRGTSRIGPFTRLTAAPVAGTNFLEAGFAGAGTYLVKTIKLETGASGTYFNSSQAIFIDAMDSLPAVPAMPINFVGSNVVGQIELSWGVSTSTNLTGFELEKKTGASFAVLQTLVPSARNAVDTNAQPDTVQSYRLRAFGPGGYSAYAGPIDITVPPLAPPVPTNIVARLDSNSVALTWSTAASATGYRVERLVQPSTNFFNIGSTSLTQFTNALESVGYFHRYRVQATNSGGASSFSEIVSVRKSIALGTALRGTGTNVGLRLTSNFGDQLIIEGSTNLTLWSVLDRLIATNVVTLWNPTNSPTKPQLFFRLRVDE